MLAGEVELDGDVVVDEELWAGLGVLGDLVVLDLGLSLNQGSWRRILKDKKIELKFNGKNGKKMVRALLLE